MSTAAISAGAPRPRKKKSSPRSTTARTVRFALLILFLLMVLLPAYVLFVTSFKPSAETSADRAWLLPQHWTTEGWSTAWDRLSPSLWRTFELAIPAALISSAIGSINGFVLSRWRFPGADVLFTLFLFGMFIPYQAVVIPLRQLTVWIGLPNGIPTLIFVHIIYGIPICTLIFRNYYASVPHELVEAAQVDGAGMFRTYASIILPLSGPGFVVTIIWQFTSAWNDFLFAVTLSSQRSWPITVALNNLAGSFSVEWNVQMAGALLAALPTLLIFILLGRFFVRGLLAGSLKG